MKREIAHYAPLMAAKQKMTEIKATIHDFNAWWMPLARDVKIWALPVPPKPGKDYISWMPALEQITFETTEGESATALAAHAVSHFHRYPEDPALNIRRWSGYVILPEQYRAQLIQKVDDINHLKDELIDILSVIPDGSRPLALRKTFPGEHILAAYRHIHCAQAELRSLWFTWQGRSPKNQAIQRDDVIQGLRHDMTTKEENDDHIIAIRQQEIATLEAMPQDSKLIYRSFFAPSPRVMVFYTQSTQKSGTADQTHHAPLPFFIAQDDLFDIHDLPFYDINQKHFDASQEKSGRREKQYDIILPRIQIYRQRD